MIVATRDISVLDVITTEVSAMSSSPDITDIFPGKVKSVVVS